MVVVVGVAVTKGEEVDGMVTQTEVTKDNRNISTNLDRFINHCPT